MNDQTSTIQIEQFGVTVPHETNLIEVKTENTGISIEAERTGFIATKVDKISPEGLIETYWLWGDGEDIGWGDGEEIEI